MAIIDSGCDLHHPDVASKVRRNPGETPNGLDDDGNGYVGSRLGSRKYCSSAPKKDIPTS